MSCEQPILCAVLIGTAPTREEAEAKAQRTRSCPYVALYVVKDRLVVGVFAIPSSKRRWIEYPQDHPEVLGLEAAAVSVTDRVAVSSPWTRGEVEPVLEEASCGTDCQACPQYRTLCQGCPATIWYCRTSAAG